MGPNVAWGVGGPILGQKASMGGGGFRGRGLGRGQGPFRGEG